jgi:adenylyl-sulfate kinase
MVIWYTGLSGSGKSTIAKAVEDHYHTVNFNLDGDVMRKGLNSDLGFSMEDRRENIRRLAHVAKYLNEYGNVQVPAITPTEGMRYLAQGIVGSDNFLLVYMSAPLEVCQQRDPKGLYKKVADEKIKDFTGIDSKFCKVIGINHITIPHTCSVKDAVYMILKAVQETTRRNQSCGQCY